jgi:hypothetical protein
VMTSYLGGGLWLDAVIEGRGTFGLPRWKFLRRLRSVEPCDGFVGPRARERGVLNGGLVVLMHVRVASDSVFFTLSGCQCQCSTTAVLSPAWRWPFGVVVYPSTSFSAMRFAPGF